MRNVVLHPLSRGGLLGIWSDTRNSSLFFIDLILALDPDGRTRCRWDLRSRNYGRGKQWTTFFAIFCQSPALRMTSVLKLAVVLACLRAFVAICCSYACITHNMICITATPMGNRV